MKKWAFTLTWAGGGMEITNQRFNHTAVISFSGKMLGEPADSKVFEKQLKDLMDAGINRIILDLKNVQRINSTGLAILITATTLCSQCSEAKVALVGVNDFIQGALTLTRLNQFFDYYDSLEEAKSWFCNNAFCQWENLYQNLALMAACFENGQWYNMSK